MRNSVCVTGVCLRGERVPGPSHLHPSGTLPPLLRRQTSLPPSLGDAGREGAEVSGSIVEGLVDGVDFTGEAVGSGASRSPRGYREDLPGQDRCTRFGCGFGERARAPQGSGPYVVYESPVSIPLATPTPPAGPVHVSYVPTPTGRREDTGPPRRGTPDRGCPSFLPHEGVLCRESCPSLWVRPCVHVAVLGRQPSSVLDPGPVTDLCRRRLKGHVGRGGSCGDVGSGHHRWGDVSGSVVDGSSLP